MIVTVVATLLVCLLAMAPGLVLLHGKATTPGQYAAASCVSLVLVQLGTALLGIIWGALTGEAIPAWSVIPVAIVALTICITMRRKALGSPFLIEWEGFVLALAMILLGLVVHAMAVQNADDGALLVHAWYNADWFKHMGHVAGIRNGGIPALDIFHAMEPLHYYWLSYLLPAAGSSLGGHNYAALITAQAIIVSLLCMTIYGTLRAISIDRAIALLSATLAFLICAPLNTWFLVFSMGLDGYLNAPIQPNAPALLATILYIPQHALVLSMLLSWFLLDRSTRSDLDLLKLAALASLASAMTISTLLGACVLAVYGLLQLWRHGLNCFPEVALMAVLSGMLVIALNVISLGAPSSAIDSPMFTDAAAPYPLPMLMLGQIFKVISVSGFPLFLSIIVLLLSRNDPIPNDEIDSRKFAILLAAIGLTAPAIAEALLTPRLAFEMSIRSVFLVTLAATLVLAPAFGRAWKHGSKQRVRALAVLAAMTILAAPNFTIWTAWHGNMGDTFTTRVPKDDRQVLALISKRAAVNELVWQYPEAPFLSHPPGRDSWVATIAGRAVTGSLRATDYNKAVPRIAAANAFFEGEKDARIDPEVDWIYLSRTLHAQTFDALMHRMRSEQGWSQVACYPDACLFKRERNVSP